MLNWDELLEGVEPTAPTVPPPSLAPSKIAADIPDNHADERKDAHCFDNRIRCIECGNLNDSGICRAATLGKIEASRTYTPIRDLLRRCDGFAPLPNDPDQRPGLSRWGALFAPPTPH